MANFSINLDNESSKRVDSKMAPLFGNKAVPAKSLIKSYLMRAFEHKIGLAPV